MKRLTYITLLSLAALSAVSCDNFLKSEDSSFYSKQYEFSNYSRTKSVCTNVYSYVRNYLEDVHGTMREAATDNAMYSWENNGIKTYYDGSWSATRTIDDLWSYYYQGIRAANYYLENAPEDFPGTEYTDNYASKMRELKNYKKEVRVLRAYYHFELAKRYRNIVIVDKMLTPEEVNGLKQTSFEDVIEWIVEEVDAVAPELPVTYEGTLSSETGRITRGAAMALKSRALLYLASPLNNEINDKNIWVRAATAAHNMMIDPEITQVYNIKREEVVNNEKSSDMIFGVLRNSSTSFESLNYPIGLNGVSGGIVPTQNLSEAFDFKEGNRHFNWDTDKDVVLDASIRDPRMRRTLRGDGNPYNALIDTVRSYYGGKNGLPKEGATPTSYYLYKFIQPDTEVQGNVKAFPHVAPIFRFAEVYLNYAEALFEASGNPNFIGMIGQDTFTKTPLSALNKVRSRFGMTELPKSITPDEFRKVLREERRVEFAFEDQRFWDIRRWMIGPETCDIYGLDIRVKKDPLTDKIKSRTVEKVLVQQRKWDDKYYWYPIPDSELFKNTNLRQNPGW